ncbi:hypothetical protein PIB30_012963 [Stylosanthes scabra]|uniref:Uncharacterized protein n=1 Tax=Stylosanthes scabra TaxID=79078 RepID=A0ABU6Z2W0_9FABA|nr:hypothetical protein [Stylosanthes scabra]
MAQNYDDVVRETTRAESPSDIDSEEASTREGESDESHYLINKEVGVFGWDDEENLGLDKIFCQKPTAQAQGINPVNLADNSGDQNRQVPLIDDESDIDSSWDNEDVIEAFEPKKVWDRSGLHFGSSNEE